MDANDDDDDEDEDEEEVEGGSNESPRSKTSRAPSFSLLMDGATCSHHRCCILQSKRGKHVRRAAAVGEEGRMAEDSVMVQEVLP